jgi:hypothetical protein
MNIRLFAAVALLLLLSFLAGCVWINDDYHHPYYGRPYYHEYHHGHDFENHRDFDHDRR